MPFNRAVRLLSRREHGAQELINKLVQKGHALTDAEAAVAKCQNFDLQSDTRFADSFCRMRIRQGYGPNRIRQELQMKQIDAYLIDEVLKSEADNWLSHALAVWEKKDSDLDTMDFAARQKKQRFLLYRGFPADIIGQLMREL